MDFLFHNTNSCLNCLTPSTLSLCDFSIEDEVNLKNYLPENVSCTVYLCEILLIKVNLFY